MAPLDDLSLARAVTSAGSRGVLEFAWVGDFIVYPFDQDGDENWQLATVAATGGPERVLTPRGASARILHVSPREPSAFLAAVNDRDPTLHDVWRCEPATGQTRCVEQNGGFAGFVADDDLHLRAAMSIRPDGGTAVFVRRDDAWAPWLEVGPEDAGGTQLLAVVGERSFWLDTTRRDKAALVERSTVGGEPKVLASDDAADVSEVGFHPGTGVPDMAVSDPGQRRRIPVDGWLRDGAWSSIPGCNVHVVSRTSDDAMWVLTLEGPAVPVRHMLLDVPSGTTRPLFEGRPDLAGWSLRPMELHTIAARDGLDLPAYLTRADTPGRLVLLVHGGPWTRDHWGFDPEHQLWADRGYSVLSVQFRGSTGFGKSFVNAGDREWAGAMLNDLLDAVAWAVAQGVAERDSVAIVGGSFGGYATLAGLAFATGVFRCGISVVGPSSLLTLLASIPPYWEPLRAVFWQRVGDDRTEEGRKALWEASPLSRVDAIQVPLLVVQGAKDPRVAEVESRQIVDALRARGRDVTYVLFPDEGHGFARPENRLAQVALAEQFLARHLGGRAEALGALGSAKVEG